MHHTSYIHPHEYCVNELRSLYNIHYLKQRVFIKQRVNKNSRSLVDSDAIVDHADIREILGADLCVPFCIVGHVVVGKREVKGTQIAVVFPVRERAKPHTARGAQNIRFQGDGRAEDEGVTVHIVANEVIEHGVGQAAGRK